MGAYLSEPVIEKISNDDDSERVRYGASSMQGWRVSQEDAHNCVVDFDKNTSLFAVYDGHGGHEVAAYCSQKLPQFIKETEAYKNGDLKTALIEAFLGFDATIATRDVVAILKEIAGVKENENEKEELGSEDEENVNNLYEEASMPIEQVMEKYQSNLLNPALKKLQGDKCPISPMLKAKKTAEEAACNSAACSSLSSSSGASSSKTEVNDISGESSDSKKDSNTDQTTISSNTNSDMSCNDTCISASNGETTSESKVEDEKQEIKTTTKEEKQEIKITIEEEKQEIKTVIEDEKFTIKTDAKNEKGEESTLTEKNESENAVDEVKKDANDSKSDVSDKNIVNGEVMKTTDESKNVSQVNGEVTKPKGKGKAIVKKSSKSEAPTNTKNLRTRNARQLYNKLLEMEEESESEDENDETFDGGPTYSSSEGSGDESSEGADDEDDGDDEDDNEDEDEDMFEDYEDNEFTRNMTEEPGSDSGCTAVVALLHGNELYVANAGDSRCIVCRNGQAVDMSFDHKPEDEPEMARIVKAGGKVTQDGRVNGGLNLSRAIGDHAYKQNKELSDREQMITALPDIKTLTINPAEDEFMVLACDGIWNFMSSQEVVDFVKPRLNKETGPEKLSQICEEMFDHCLAPHTMGDGTGCDNMTAVIVQFKNAVMKRSASSDVSEKTEEENSAKRAKTEQTTD